MRKTLRYSLLLLLSLFVGNGVFATDVTIDFSTKGYENTASVAQVSQNGILVNFYAGTNSNGPKYYTTGTAIRCYGGNYFTVKASSANITKIVFTFASGEGANAITADSGTFENATWTGEANNVKFTISGTTGHRRIQKLVVTYDEGTDSRTDANLSFSTTTASAKVGKAFTAPTLTNANNVSVEYSSSNTGVATVDASTGAVTLVAAGTTTITASVPESNTQYKGSASYTLTVEAATATVTLPYEEKFVGVGIGKFSINNVTIDAALSYVWGYQSSYGMVASAYKNYMSYTTESWLISPIINLAETSAPTFTFKHAVNKFTDVNTAQQEATVWVREGEEGAWTQISGITYPSTLAWTFVDAGSISLSEYKGKQIQIGFKYTSDATKSAGTWEIQNFQVVDGKAAGIEWSKSSVTIDKADSEHTYPTLTNPNNLEVSYKSSDESVATIDASGSITLNNVGTTTISAIFAGNATYSESTVTYTLKVIDSNAKGGKNNPYTVDEIKEMAIPSNTSAAAGQEKVWVKGYIVGLAVTGEAASEPDTETKSNIALSASGSRALANYIPVQLGSSGAEGTVRTALNLVDHSDNVGKEVMVYGYLLKYFNVTGVKNTSDYVLTGNSTEVSGINNLKTDDSIDNNAPIYNLAGQRVGKEYKGVVIVNGKKVKR